MKIANKIQKIFYTFLFLICINTAFSADPPDFDDDVVDAPATPIDGYIWVLAAIGLVYVFLRLRTFAKESNN
jgi:hypothetical protein